MTEPSDNLNDQKELDGVEELWRQLKADPENVELRNDILKKYVDQFKPMMWKYSGWYDRRNRQENDLLGMVWIGLDYASREYDIDSGEGFSKLATKWVKEALKAVVNAENRERYKVGKILDYKRTSSRREISNEKLTDENSPIDSLAVTVDEAVHSIPSEYLPHHLTKAATDLLLRVSMESLDETEQRRVKLHLLDKKTPAEIARIEGKHRGWIGRNLKKSVAKMRTKLGIEVRPSKKNTRKSKTPT